MWIMWDKREWDEGILISDPGENDYKNKIKLTSSSFVSKIMMTGTDKDRDWVLVLNP